MIENSVATVENTITVGNHILPIKEYNNIRVVTFKDIDMVHERPDGTARKRFNDNKKYFIEGEDFYKISPSEFRTAIGDMDRRQQNDVTLITESGYLMLVKSFTDDLAWQVQRELVNTYFRVKDVVTIMGVMTRTIQDMSARMNQFEALPDEVATLKKEIKKLTPTPLNCSSWKRNIATPLVSSLSKIIDIPIAETYKFIYDDMASTYGFDKIHAMTQFCNKYKVDNVSTIDAVADVPTYMEMFAKSVHKFLDMNNPVPVLDTSNTNAKLKVNNNISVSKSIIDYSTLTVEEIIKPLVDLYHDTSVNNAYTYKRVYKVMRSDRSWKALMTRRSCKSKKNLVTKFDDIKRDFVKAVNQLMEIGTVEAGGEV
nr:MAG TPA: hypothetical protein [Caudoviricetes sp.]